MSLPRSGSSLLQSLLSFNGLIESGPEPWALPWIMDVFKNYSFAQYNSRLRNIAVREFLDDDDTLYTLSKTFLESIYATKKQDTSMPFLDKTPRNFYFIEEIEKLWGLQSCVFLLRNPVDIYFSILAKHKKGIFTSYSDVTDLWMGSRLIGEVIENKRVTIVHYEDLVEHSVDLSSVLRSMNIKAKANVSYEFDKSFSTKTMGDKSKRLQSGRVESISRTHRVSLVHYLWLRYVISKVDKSYTRASKRKAYGIYENVKVDKWGLSNLKDLIAIIYFSFTIVTLLARFKDKRWRYFYG